MAVPTTAPVSAVVPVVIRHVHCRVLAEVSRVVIIVFGEGGALTVVWSSVLARDAGARLLVGAVTLKPCGALIHLLDFFIDVVDEVF